MVLINSLVINAAQEEPGWLPDFWLIAGPFEQMNSGFGEVDDRSLINESKNQPYPGKLEISELTRDNKVVWKLHHPDRQNYIDFNEVVDWDLPNDSPLKIWYGKEAYAATYIESPVDCEILFHSGANTRLKVYLNENIVYSGSSDRPAIADDVTIPLALKQGKNRLLIRVTNSHSNLVADWFGGVPWGWGFYSRFSDSKGAPLADILIGIQNAESTLDYELVSTFFFRQAGDGLKQQFDLVVNSDREIAGPLEFVIQLKKNKYPMTIENIPPGISRHPFYLPELQRDLSTECVLKTATGEIRKQQLLFKRKKYSMYLNMTAHMDIGYTNTQPIVIERHIETIDDVIDYCERDPAFKWTIESTWCMEQFEKNRSPERFQQLVKLINDKQIDVSPIYSNPYTGWISLAELDRSFDVARRYTRDYGLDYGAALVNDLPGMAWVMPQALQQMGVPFLVCGINEIFGGYLLQEKLPKVFAWEGSDGSTVLTYITEAYNEGRSIGLEKGFDGIRKSLWQVLNKLEARNYRYDLVYLNAGMCDNCGIPEEQFETALEWNTEYAYPKFIISNATQFAHDFIGKYKDQLPRIRGDWTSDWDTQYQSEPELFIKHRAIQHKLVSAEKLNSLNWWLNSENYPAEALLQSAYAEILSFAGHGSGLEFSYGSAEENYWAVAYREGNISRAELLAEELAERSMYRFCLPHFSFEKDGIMVFNTLGWPRDAMVEIDLPLVNQNHYRVVNLVDGSTVPCFQRDNLLLFVAHELPALGYRKYALETVEKGLNQNPASDGSAGDSIENEFFRLTVDPLSGVLKSIIDKTTNRECIRSAVKPEFGQVFFLRNFERTLNYPAATLRSITVFDEDPVRKRLLMEFDNTVIKATEYTLWSGLDRIGVSFKMDMSRLEASDVIEEWGIAFPFQVPDAEFRFETIGGFLKPGKDQFPAKREDLFSIRRTVAINTAETGVNVVAIDSRISGLINDNRGEQTLYSNMINNFPQGWNRNQIREGILETRFGFNVQDAEFSPGKSARFGWELATPALAFRWPLSSDNPEAGFIQCNNANVLISGIRSSVDTNELILQVLNVSPEQTETVQIRSNLFIGHSIFLTNLALMDRKALRLKKDTIELNLKPNEIGAIIVQQP